MTSEERRNRKRKRGKRRQKPAASPPPTGDGASSAKHKSANSSSVSAVQRKTISKPNKTSFIDKVPSLPPSFHLSFSKMRNW